jgi:amino acid transporter
MKPEQKEPAESAEKGYSFNTFSGVFLPSILTILGVVMFMRLGTVTGELGITGALGILLVAESIAVATGLSISAISTNTPVKSGGPYFLISRSLGPGFGTSIGLTYYVSQSLSVPFYVIGFTEAFVKVFPQFEPALLWVGMIPLIILFTIAIVGANWAIRTQYAIMAILAVSIVVILSSAAFGVPGPSAETFLANLYARKGVNVNILVLATNFAVFFPAVTGFLAGVNMSGDLQDPRKSIPRGTMLAIAAGFVIYLVEILLFGATWPREKLLAYYETLKENAIFHTWFLVFAGVAAATLSSALGTLIGAPRILQAFAADKIFTPLNFFAWGRGKNNDPIPAMCLTLLISAGILLWGSRQGSGGSALNAVAELVTMFTLCTYGIINIAAAVEHFAANPSFRPKFRLFHWAVGCYGAAACFAVALFINAGLLLVAFFIVGVLFLIARRKSLASTFGDARRGYYFERIRRCLIHLASMPSDAKNWRPQILILAGPHKKHLALIRYGSLLNNERGIMSVARFLNPGPDPAAAEHQRRQEEEQLRALADESGTAFFPVAVTTSEETDFDEALNVFLQSHSLGPLAPNIVLSGWPVNEDRVEAFFRHLQTIRLLRMNTLVLINPERAAEEPGDGPIDIWWRGRQNGTLMLILAHLLTCNRGWHKTTIRLLRLADPEHRLEAEQELAQLAYDSRIEAQHLVLSQEENFETAFRAYSSHASLVFLGFIPPKVEDCRSFYERINAQLEGMPATFLAASAGDTDLDS